MISMIAAVGKNMELGKDNKLIWHIPTDMKFFKETTTGHKVVMGKKTFESLPGKLPNREMIVISTSLVDSSVKVERSINSIVDKYINSDEEVFIIGGASIYMEFLPYANKIYLTEINDCLPDADVFFPKFDKKEWKKVQIIQDSFNECEYSINLYERIK